MAFVTVGTYMTSHTECLNHAWQHAGGLQQLVTSQLVTNNYMYSSLAKSHIQLCMVSITIVISTNRIPKRSTILVNTIVSYFTGPVLP